MATITVSKELARNKNLIAVPKTAFEAFLSWQKKTKSSRKFKPTVSERQALRKARENFRKGKFLSLTDLRHDLERRLR